MRYVGQNFELRVPVAHSDGGCPEVPPVDVVRAHFAEAHERLYGFANADDEVEVVNLRLGLHGLQPLAPTPDTAPEPAGAPQPASNRAVHFDARGAMDTLVFDRETLRPGHAFDGPAIIEQMDATTVVAPDERVRVDASANLWLEHAAD